MKVTKCDQCQKVKSEPQAWIQVAKASSYYQTGTEQRGPWDFCSWRCTEEYAREKAK